MHGKVKTLYSTDDAETVLIKYEDKVTAFDGKMIDYPKDKGATCCLISSSTGSIISINLLLGIPQMVKVHFVYFDLCRKGML